MNRRDWIIRTLGLGLLSASVGAQAGCGAGDGQLPRGTISGPRKTDAPPPPPPKDPPAPSKGKSKGNLSSKGAN